MKRVLVIRPEPGAAETAARLSALGYRPISLPLTEIIPLSRPHLPDAASFDAVAVTSANAVRHAPAELIEALAGKPIFAVGERTGQEARDKGLQVANVPTGDAEDLAHALVAALPAGARVLVLCGRVRRNVLETRLNEAGCVYQLIETYDTKALEPADDAVRAIIGDQPIDAVLVHSANAAEQLSRLAKRPVAGTIFNRAAFFCISKRVAGVLHAFPSDRVKSAQDPNEESLMAALKAGI